jgi:hypothetical protein
MQSGLLSPYLCIPKFLQLSSLVHIFEFEIVVIVLETLFQFFAH